MSRKSQDDGAQVHILEMVTLFWLFFMSAMFIIQIHVPDSASVASDATLELAAEDSLRIALAVDAEDTQYDNRLVELLASDDKDGACELVLSGLTATVDGECWLTKDAGTATIHGDGVQPVGRSVTVHRLLQVDSDVWTVTVDAWHRGGGA